MPFPLPQCQESRSLFPDSWPGFHNVAAFSMRKELSLFCKAERMTSYSFVVYTKARMERTILVSAD